MMLAGQCSCMFLGGFVESLMGPQFTITCGGFFCVFGTLFNSWSTSLGGWLFGSLLFGAGVGIAYTAPFSCAMRWLPKSRGLPTGCIIAGFGGGAFVFGLIGNFLLRFCFISSFISSKAIVFWTGPSHLCTFGRLCCGQSL